MVSSDSCNDAAMNAIMAIGYAYISSNIFITKVVVVHPLNAPFKECFLCIVLIEGQLDCLFTYN